MESQQVVGSTDQILRRICGEYFEMPGLHLTCAQAQRLWVIDADLCQCLMDTLVELKFLCRTRDGAYWRLNEGRAPCLPCGSRFFSW